MAIATLYHNPRCSKSRAALSLLEQQALDLKVIEYLKTPPDRENLLTILNELQVQPMSIVRTGDALFKQLGLDKNSLTQEHIINLLLEHPKLLERPIVQYNGKATVGRPIENIESLLAE